MHLFRKDQLRRRRQSRRVGVTQPVDRGSEGRLYERLLREQYQDPDLILEQRWHVDGRARCGLMAAIAVQLSAVLVSALERSPQCRALHQNAGHRSGHAPAKWENLTFESRGGFPPRLSVCGLAHAFPGISGHLAPCRPSIVGGARRGPQRRPESMSWSARIVRRSADGIGPMGSAADRQVEDAASRAGRSASPMRATTVCCGQDTAIAHAAARPGGGRRVVALTLSDPPAEGRHWVAAGWRKATGIASRSVQRIWRAHGLRPHRVRQSSFERSRLRRQSAMWSGSTSTRRATPSCSLDEKSQVPGARPHASPACR